MNEVQMFEIKENTKVWKIPLNRDECDFYNNCIDLIIARDSNKFLELINTVEDYKKWINKTILVIRSKNLSMDNTNVMAMTLCHLAAINNSRVIMKILIKNGGDLSKQVIEVTDSRKVSTERTVFSLILIHFREPIEFLRGFLDDSINCEDKGNDYEFELDFSVLCPNTNDKWTTDYIDEVPIQQMMVLNSILNSTDDIHSEQYELLKHPLIESFLTCKWKYYRRFFFTLVILHLLFVSSVSSAIILMVKSFQLFHNETIPLLIKATLESYQNQTDEVEFQRLVNISTDFLDLMEIIKIFNIFSVIFGGFLFVHAIIQASFIPLKKLIWEFEIMLNLFTAPSAMIISIYMIYMPYEGYFDNDHRWIYHVSSFLILPVWIDLMLLVGRFPRLGCYSLMFTTVLLNFLKVMISFIFLIIGFALSFSLMFPKSEYFRDPGHATLRTIVMMVGEFDYMNTFSEEENYFIIGTSRLIFLLFIISCSIILMNLTQGIAVNDIKVLHDISQVIRLEKESRFLYELECVFSHPIMISHPVLRKIKRHLYDNGTKIEPIKVNRDDKQGLTNSVYNRLVKEYKFIK